MEEEEKITISIKKIGSCPPRQLQVSPKIRVSELRRLVGAEVNLPIERLKLFLHGAVLDDTKGGREMHVNLNESVQRFNIPESAAQWKKNLLFVLRDKLRVPDILLVTILSISLKTWGMVFLWFIMAPIAYRWDLGPLYILTTAFSMMFFNLGQRQQGDASAYSIFNDDFRELPGTLNAERLDRDIRAGQFAAGL
ncbi:uncharacterized protein LOC131061089 isoform X3 [Cryptomeria japonica]|uniref:uncharacterized protein LOC131061089 isoform X3 n=1 Tax=Cryptomeria japonica TaxID=3369 RepID=UPI0025ABF562|nr:uncharacterized protein LOC131061089 isoform X3 [Cryptomeria japonica]